MRRGSAVNAGALHRAVANAFGGRQNGMSDGLNI
jgi:hypothetical protein